MAIEGADRHRPVGTGYGLVKGATLLTVTTEALDRKYRGQFRVTGPALQAIKEAHTKMGRFVQREALKNLEAGLHPKRKSVNDINKQRNRGLRAALAASESVVVDSYAKYWGVGDPRIFARYGALDYYRVIERGGGFQGRLFGVLLDANDIPTRGPTGRRSGSKTAVQDAQRAYAKADLALRTRWAGVQRAEQARQAVRNKRGFPMTYDDARKQINDELAAAKATLQERLADAAKGRRQFGKSGAPFAGWQNTPGAAAGGFRKARPGEQGYWFIVRNKVQAVRYMENAVNELQRSGLIERYYEEAFREHRVPWQPTAPGAVRVDQSGGSSYNAIVNSYRTQSRREAGWSMPRRA